MKRIISAFYWLPAHPMSPTCNYQDGNHRQRQFCPMSLFSASPPCRIKMSKSRFFPAMIRKQIYLYLHSNCNFLPPGFRIARSLIATSGRLVIAPYLCARALCSFSPCLLHDQFSRIHRLLYLWSTACKQSHLFHYRNHKRTEPFGAAPVEMVLT